MYFAHPLSLLLLLTIPVLILLHFFRKRKNEERVPSLILWKNVIAQDSESKKQKFSLDLPLLFLISAVAIASLGAASPRFSSRKFSSKMVLVIDNSASMTSDATFNKVIKEAEELISSAPAHCRISIITAQKPARIICKDYESSLALKTLANIVPSIIEEDLREAVLLASGISGKEKPILFSDHVEELPVEVLYNARGKSMSNRGFVSATVYQNKLFFAVANFSDTPFRGEVTLAGFSPSPLSISVSVAANDRRDFRISLSDRLPEELTLELSPADSFPIDNQLHVRRKGRSFVKITLQGFDESENEFGIPRVISSLKSSGNISIEESYITGGTGIENIDADCIISCGGEIIDGIPGLYFKPIIPETWEIDSTNISGELKVANPVHISFRQIEGSPISLEKNELHKGYSLPESPEWKPVLLCEDKPVLSGKGDNYFASFLPRPVETNWIKDPTFLIFVGNFIKQSAADSTGFFLSRTNHANPTTGHSRNGSFNLLSDSESNLSVRSSTPRESLPSSGITHRDDTVKLGGYLFLLAALLFTLYLSGIGAQER